MTFANFISVLGATYFAVLLLRCVDKIEAPRRGGRGDA